jgi:alkanesulfonate monooxygenase SsuD/methylene tetrahydromethanopterin reductase-like flavin-dependent oxidoreductase (luciferase family)
MRVGIGLPVTTKGTSGELLLAWARRAEEAGFETLTALDRIVYPGFESMTAMAAAAAVTSRIGLRTNVLLAPVRSGPVVAKQAASVDQVSGGRFMLGIGVGRRSDDYEAVDRDFHTRGRRLDADLEAMHAEWSGQPAGGRSRPSSLPPVRDGAVPVFFGGSLDAAIPRIVRWGVGWSVSSRGPEETRDSSERVRAAWSEAGREGSPIIMVMHYFALGEDSNVDYLLDYYGYQGERARMFAEGAYRRAADVTTALRDFAAIGVDEYVFIPTMADLNQVDRLAEAVHAAGV